MLALLGACLGGKWPGRISPPSVLSSCQRLWRGEGEVNTQRLAEHDQWLATTTSALHSAIRAIWLELGSSGTLSEDTVLSLQRILATMRRQLDRLQRDVEATAGSQREPLCLSPIAHLTPQEKRDMLQALYEHFFEQEDPPARAR